MSGEREDRYIAGNKQGGLKAAQTTKQRHGNDHYKRIGAMGGKAKVPTKGFGYRRECNCEIIKELHTKPMCSGVKGGSKRR